MRYISKTSKAEMTGKINCEDLENKSLRLILYVDSDFAGCKETSKSTSGMYLVLKGERGTNIAIDWASRKQNFVTTSTTEAEIVALSDGIKKIGLNNQMILSAVLGWDIKMEVLTDSLSGLRAIQDGYGKLKHMRKTQRISFAYIKELCERDIIEIKHVDGNQNIADIFTKPLNRVQHTFLCEKMGLDLDPENVELKDVKAPNNGGDDLVCKDVDDNGSMPEENEEEPLQKSNEKVEDTGLTNFEKTIGGISGILITMQVGSISLNDYIIPFPRIYILWKALLTAGSLVNILIAITLLYMLIAKYKNKKQSTSKESQDVQELPKDLPGYQVHISEYKAIKKLGAAYIPKNHGILLDTGSTNYAVQLNQGDGFKPVSPEEFKTYINKYYKKYPTSQFGSPCPEEMVQKDVPDNQMPYVLVGSEAVRSAAIALEKDVCENMEEVMQVLTMAKGHGTTWVMLSIILGISTTTLLRLRRGQEVSIRTKNQCVERLNRVLMTDGDEWMSDDEEKQPSASSGNKGIPKDTADNKMMYMDETTSEDEEKNGGRNDGKSQYEKDIKAAEEEYKRNILEIKTQISEKYEIKSEYVIIKPPKSELIDDISRIKKGQPFRDSRIIISRDKQRTLLGEHTGMYGPTTCVPGGKRKYLEEDAGEREWIEEVGTPFPAEYVYEIGKI